MTIEVEREQPVKDAEKAIADAVPEVVRPEVEAIKQQFNEAVDQAAEQAPEAEVQAAQTTPAIEQAAQDAARVLKGGTIDVLAAEKDATAVVKEVKAGYKTTEFWLSAVVILLTQIGAFDLPGKYGKTITTAAAATAYAISRGLAK